MSLLSISIQDPFTDNENENSKSIQSKDKSKKRVKSQGPVQSISILNWKESLNIQLLPADLNYFYYSAKKFNLNYFLKKCVWVGKLCCVLFVNYVYALCAVG